ncbi:unnamed protein product [Microthlaspi erraticum]|uniref:Uncharacterized protein n=1 Tax=Microthlaspi erraticum TaxID=1685480 RepID=A0A6D2KFX2_9BRAS|nr:unnamed protein product [Microthlaspi erraticum]
MPPRDDGSLAIDLGMFGLGSPAPILGMVDDWTNYGSDRVGIAAGWYNDRDDTIISRSENVGGGDKYKDGVNMLPTSGNSCSFSNVCCRYCRTRRI